MYIRCRSKSCHLHIAKPRHRYLSPTSQPTPSKSPNQFPAKTLWSAPWMPYAPAGCAFAVTETCPDMRPPSLQPWMCYSAEVHRNTKRSQKSRKAPLSVQQECKAASQHTPSMDCDGCILGSHPLEHAHSTICIVVQLNVSTRHALAVAKTPLPDDPSSFFDGERLRASCRTCGRISPPAASVFQGDGVALEGGLPPHAQPQAKTPLLILLWWREVESILRELWVHESSRVHQSSRVMG